jgi:hypothetical protein
MITYAVSSGNTGVFWLARNKSCVRFSERNTSEWTDVGFSAEVYKNTTTMMKLKIEILYLQYQPLVMKMISII